MTVSVFERETLATLSLPEGSRILRARQCPPSLRDANYDARFDFHTLYYDAFLTEDGRQVRLPGPVLANLAPHVLSGGVFEITAEGQRKGLPFKIYQKRKVTYLDIDLPEKAENSPLLRLNFGPLGKYEFRPNPNESKLFAGRRVAFTLFKFEPLEWLREWIDFNVKYHGADAFLLYHNDSDTFTAEDVAAVLRSVPGVRAGAVLNWPFPYGPDGTQGDHWESNFCQVGMMAQARWRFLQQAKSVLNGDIDELVITRGHRSIFDIVEQSRHQYVEIPGAWSGYGEGDVRSEAFSARRHRHMTHFVDGSSERPAQNKWAVVPAACPDDGRWSAHFIGRMDGEQLSFEDAGLRHFRDLNAHWKVKRNSDDGAVGKDSLLQEAYRKIGWL
jgi:hypothetical protein